MKQIMIFLTSLMLLAMTGQAAFAKEVEVSGSFLGKSSQEQVKQQVLTSDLITLYGSKDSAELTYQIPAGASSGSQQLVIEYEASNLLISPSSLTAVIDDEPVKTLKLDGDSKRKTVKLNLNKSQSAQGYHNVSLKFYGVMKEGVCVRQDTSGNWIKIYPDSRLTLADSSEAKGTSLDHYPYPFAQSGNTAEKTAIVIPDDPSSAEIEAAVKTEGYLKTVDSSISISYVTESELKKIDKPTIFIGVDKHWNGKVKKLMKQAGLQAKGEKLLLAERVLKAEGKQQPVLFAQAASADVLTEKISVITDQTYTGQLSGDTLSISKLQQAEKKESNKLTLENFGADDITIGADKTSSAHYFYPASAVLDQNQSAKLSLKLKKSETIQASTAENGSASQAAELKVMINGQPHSVGLDELGKEDKNGFYHVTVKVDPKLLQKNRYIDIQFVSTGLKENNPCNTTDEEKWVFIDKSSTLAYAIKGMSPSADFQEWPLPYAGNQEQTTLIVLPDTVSQSKLEELSLVTESFGSEAQHSYTIKKSSDITANDAKGRNLIFLGGINQLSLLKERSSDLLVPQAKNGSFDVSGFEMLNETTKQVAFTQASLWDSGYTMAVFAPSTGNGTAVTKEIISYLNSTDDSATVVNETNSQQVFTNHQQLKSETNSSSAEQPSQDHSQKWLYIGVLALIMVIAAVFIWIAVRRRKRKTDTE
ncbi:cellulose biosynthesis cyclic di-GMP-binding regulatory protein BcsB [Bacillus inaquosorum]|uniref:cellulose biosynthesis cyclic di-GMP-binding regulatory protein BcsB n=2 Tax=Bacillus inaquosorum TaxID=483913 RepID=UPI002282372B|nr:cellulose biosynthesis cyclic di-GMP-binding regulatory protein BcsB [Bacillus inaquosorum]MCY8788589.1 cellulose biosynthesis cyclic di-GMP-binding regulatory protein BcsB [Bacillus inaquosorum]MCY9012083.1 cellulose biosynthesis cyclic di-GMP-binding regulatory protein BcsB [Bacillus inaquosorum]MCY9039896.1 cellulose biosynthesis cyclic di-GMP-binding regulatory protein BcsB [Bacillus inaquosorum]MCY9102189.1 cellulose biosynthesis cyclic di-GMP-binding regulatory protein BcsB [Bacillus i